MKKAILTILTVLLFGVCPAQADLGFESGYNTYDDSDGYNFEVWVINNASLDVTGGEMYKLGLSHYSTVNIVDGANIEVVESLFTDASNTVRIYGGNVDKLWIGNNSSIAHIYGSNISELQVSGTATINLYAYDLTHTTTGGYLGYGQLMGTYYSDNSEFTFDLGWDAYSHINIVPEPATLLLFTFGAVLLKR